MNIVVFLGYSNSGKTTAIVRVVEELAKSGMKVGTLKHIHDEGFTIDRVGKDTWRHASAGATTVVALAPEEIAIIEKGDTSEIAIDDLIDIFTSRHVDYLIIEGLYRKLSRRKGVTRVLCARSVEEAEELLAIHPRPVCILNRREGGVKSILGVPILALPRDMKKFMSLIGRKGGTRGGRESK